MSARFSPSNQPVALVPDDFVVPSSASKRQSIKVDMTSVPAYRRHLGGCWLARDIPRAHAIAIWPLVIGPSKSWRRASIHAQATSTPLICRSIARGDLRDQPSAASPAAIPIEYASPSRRTVPRVPSLGASGRRPRACCEPSKGPASGTLTKSADRSVPGHVFSTLNSRPNPTLLRSLSHQSAQRMGELRQSRLGGQWTVFDCFAATAHGVRIAVEPLLDRFQNVLVLPSRYAPLVAGRAFRFQRATGAELD